MASKKSRSDRLFLEKQRHQLTELRKQILEVRHGHECEQASINAEVNAQAREYEDDAQKLTTLELQGKLAAVDDQRLNNIKGALQEIDDGTYGLSDASGAPIAIDRLQASPEALYTLEGQKTRDSVR